MKTFIPFLMLGAIVASLASCDFFASKQDPKIYKDTSIVISEEPIHKIDTLSSSEVKKDSLKN